MTGLPTTLFSRGDFLAGTADACFLAAALDGVTGALDYVTFEVLDFISLFVGDIRKLSCGVSVRLLPHSLDNCLANHTHMQWVIDFQW